MTDTVTYHTEDGRQVTLHADLWCPDAAALEDEVDASGAQQWELLTPPPALWGLHGAGPHPLHSPSRTLWSDYAHAPWALWDPDAQLITPLVDAQDPSNSGAQMCLHG